MLAEKLQASIHVRVEEAENQVLGLRMVWLLRQRSAPGLNIGLPAQVAGREVDHATARHGGRGGDLQVLHLEEHAHRPIQLDALAVGQTERHVVIQHRVHVLNPNGIHRPIKHCPLVVQALVGLEGTHEAATKAIRPLLGHLVEFAIELSHGDALRVEAGEPSFLISLIGAVVLAERRERDRKRLVIDCLAAERRSHEHDPKANHECLEELDGLRHELVIDLQTLLRERPLHFCLQRAVVAVRHLDAREQVVDDGEE
mmetsp:Transcript_41623/g.67221  ORF Transcript_41623/g.67221 Transcript_41623/m.67221 type:complete len:257 (+) Transcript_41623:2030-2800(+)